MSGAQGVSVLVSSLRSRALLLSRAVGWSFPAPVPALQPADNCMFMLRGLVCAAWLAEPSSQRPRGREPEPARMYL